MSENSSVYHVPALLRESVELLDINPSGVYVDVTFGGGGHSREILSRLGPQGHLFGFDRDIESLVNAPDDPRFTFVLSDYRFIENFLRYYGVERVDGILADLGVSFHHFDAAERGFSFRNDAPLDMRMTRTAPLTAEALVNALTANELRELLKTHADLRNVSAVASAIEQYRKERKIETTFNLTEAVTPALDPRNVKKELAQVFQAFRIKTNDEMGSLRALLLSSLKVLKTGGRLAVLTYHSGEDRLVKEFMKTGEFGKSDTNRDHIYGQPTSPWKLITRNPITASKKEIERNPRARSAKLRCVEKR